MLEVSRKLYQIHYLVGEGEVTVTKYRKVCGLTEIHCLTALESRHPRSGCWQGCFLPRASREGSVPGLSSHFWGCAGRPRGSLDCGSTTLISPFIFTSRPPCGHLCVRTSPLQEGGHQSC